MVAKLIEFKFDKLNWGAGLRVAVGLLVSLIVLAALGLRQYWPSLSFGVLFVGISDLASLGAPISTRMRRMAITTLVGALMTGLGTALGVNWELAVLGAFVVTLLCGASLAWGKPAALAAYLINIWFFVSLSFYGGVTQALPEALAWLVGGALYMLLALVRFRWGRSSSEPAQGPAPAQESGSLLGRYFAFFRFTSPLFRFVLLKTLAVTLATAIGLGFNLPYAHWIPIFTLVVMQPGTEASLFIFVLRLLGTIVGALLAAVLLSGVQNNYLLDVIILVCAFIAATLHDVNMLTYLVFSTLALLLLDGLLTPPGSLADVQARVLDALIGALIAIVFVFLYRGIEKMEASNVASE